MHPRELYCRSMKALHKVLTSRNSGTRRFSQTAFARSNPYPFPSSSNPTPYQIFHLLPDASPAEVKQRYYELVRLYHPDSVESKKHQPNPTLRHSQFSAITKAYESIQKRTQSGDDNMDERAFSNPWRRAPHVTRRAYREETFVNDGWKDKLIWVGLCASLLTVGIQYVYMRQSSIIHIRQSAPPTRDDLSKGLGSA